MSNEGTPEQVLQRIKEIAIGCGIADANGMCVTLSAFKKHPNLEVHKFTNGFGYKAYFGVPTAIGLIEYFPIFYTRNKTKIIEQFWGDLKNAVNLNDLETIEVEDLRVRQKYSIAWT